MKLEFFDSTRPSEPTRPGTYLVLGDAVFCLPVHPTLFAGTVILAFAAAGVWLAVLLIRGRREVS
jgi:hypothetical protein